jgi:hypothetical protein
MSATAFAKNEACHCSMSLKHGSFNPKSQVLGQTDLSGAIQYCLNEWEKFECYTLFNSRVRKSQRAYAI